MSNQTNFQWFVTTGLCRWFMGNRWLIWLQRQTLRNSSKPLINVVLSDASANFPHLGWRHSIPSHIIVLCGYTLHFTQWYVCTCTSFLVYITLLNFGEKMTTINKNIYAFGRRLHPKCAFKVYIFISMGSLGIKPTIFWTSKAMLQEH